MVVDSFEELLARLSGCTRTIVSSGNTPVTKPDESSDSGRVAAAAAAAAATAEGPDMVAATEAVPVGTPTTKVSLLIAFDEVRLGD